MKKAQSLSKFKNNELKKESLSALVGGNITYGCTTWVGGCKSTDSFDSKSALAGGGWGGNDVKPVNA